MEANPEVKRLVDRWQRGEMAAEEAATALVRLLIH
jgi:hypothetical protein